MSGVGASLLQAAWANGSKWLNAYETGASLRQKQQQIDLSSQAQSFQQVMAMLNQQQQQFQNGQGQYEFDRKQGFNEYESQAKLAQQQQQFEAQMQERQRLNQSMIDLRGAQQSKYGSQYDPGIGAAISGADLPTTAMVPPVQGGADVAQNGNSLPDTAGIGAGGLPGLLPVLPGSPQPGPGMAGTTGNLIGPGGQPWMAPDDIRKDFVAKAGMSPEDFLGSPMADKMPDLKGVAARAVQGSPVQTNGSGGVPAANNSALKAALSAYVGAVNSGNSDDADKIAAQIPMLKGAVSAPPSQLQGPERQIGPDEASALAKTKSDLAQGLATLRSMPQTPDVQKQMQVLNEQFAAVTGVQAQGEPAVIPGTATVAPVLPPINPTTPQQPIIPAPKDPDVQAKLRRLDTLSGYQKAYGKGALATTYARELASGEAEISRLMRDPDVRKAMSPDLPAGASVYGGTIKTPEGTKQWFDPTAWGERERAKFKNADPLEQSKALAALQKAYTFWKAQEDSGTPGASAHADFFLQRLGDMQTQMYAKPVGVPGAAQSPDSVQPKAPPVSPAQKAALGTRLDQTLKALRGK